MNPLSRLEILVAYLGCKRTEIGGTHEPEIIELEAGAHLLVDERRVRISRLRQRKLANMSQEICPVRIEVEIRHSRPLVVVRAVELRRCDRIPAPRDVAAGEKACHDVFPLLHVVLEIDTAECGRRAQNVAE